MAQVALRGILGVDDAAEPGADRAQPGSGGDQVFDLVLGVVVQFVAAGPEDLDAVVGHRVVRRRDHHPEVGVVGAGQVGHRGGGEHADPQRVDPSLVRPAMTAASSISPLARGSRPITATRRRGSPELAKPPRRRGAQRQRQLGGQLAIGDSANTVGAE